MCFAAMLFASCSEEADYVYDKALSNTVWTSIVLTTPLVSYEEHYWVSESILEVLERLESTSIVVEEKDTISYPDFRNDRVLSFGNNTCELTDTFRLFGPYRIQSYEVKISHYPDQTYSEDVGNGYMINVVVRDDRIVLKSIKDGKMVYSDTIHNNVREKGKDLGISEEFDDYCKIETYRMTFTREGDRITMNGDKELVGTVHKDLSKIEIEGYGTFYRNYLR